MNVADKELKKLWGRAAGRCSKPDCCRDCIPFLNPDEPTVIGEMAHVIPRKRGPRNTNVSGSSSYDNLILLCPTHHTEIDKAPTGTFPAETLYRWKAEHEARIRGALEAPKYETIEELSKNVEKLLIENKSVWKELGPESIEAKSNPASNLKTFWDLRKLDTIVHNNSRIVFILRLNSELFNRQEYEECAQFILHADAFERNCYERTEGVPRFPQEFELMVNSHVKS